MCGVLCSAHSIRDDRLFASGYFQKAIVHFLIHLLFLVVSFLFSVFEGGQLDKETE